MTDRATAVLLQQMSEIDSRRRELMLQEQRAATQLDAARQEQVHQLGQVRHSEDRLHSLRAAVQQLQHSAAASKEFAADAASRVDKARIEEPVLLRVATDNRDAANEALARWQKGVADASSAGAAWGILNSANNNASAAAVGVDAAQAVDRDNAAASSSSSSTSNNCNAKNNNSDGNASAAAKQLQHQIALVEADIVAAQQQDVACRNRAAALAQESLQLRAAIKELTDFLAAPDAAALQVILQQSSNQQQQQQQQHQGRHHEDDAQQRQQNQLKDAQSTPPPGGDVGAALDRLRREIEEEETSHNHKMSKPRHDVAGLKARVAELGGWVDDNKMQLRGFRAAAAEMRRKAAAGLCSVCSASAGTSAAQ